MLVDYLYRKVYWIVNLKNPLFLAFIQLSVTTNKILNLKNTWQGTHPNCLIRNKIKDNERQKNQAKNGKIEK